MRRAFSSDCFRKRGCWERSHSSPDGSSRLRDRDARFSRAPRALKGRIRCVRWPPVSPPRWSGSASRVWRELRNITRHGSGCRWLSQPRCRNCSRELKVRLARGEMPWDERKPVVLATVPYYLPGFKGGGKLIAVRNLVAALNDQFRFKVMTADRDLGDADPYRGITSDTWVGGSHGEVFYLQRQRGWLRAIREQLSRGDYDVLYLNTVFSRPFGIVPLILQRFGAIARRPVMVAPRGEFAPG